MKKILIIAYAFPPSARSGIFRIVHFSEHLAERRHYQPHVLTVLPKNYEEDDSVDNTTLKKVHNEVRVSRTKCIQIREAFLNLRLSRKPYKKEASLKTNSLYAKKAKSKRKKSIQTIKDIITEEILSFPDKYIGWLPFAVMRGLSIIKKENIEIVFATGAPWTSFLIGKSLSWLARLPLVMDYRDPWIGNPFHESKKTFMFNSLSRKLEQVLLKNTDAVILNTESLKNDFIQRYGESKNLYVIPNGYLERDIAAVKLDGVDIKDNEFVFIHAGALYGHRSIDQFLKAFRFCLEEKKFGEKLAKLILIGAGEAARHKCLSILGHRMFHKHCDVTDRLPHQECLSIMKSAHCLLLFQQSTSVQVPRKIFEYLALRKPILAITPKDGDTSGIIQKKGAGVVTTDHSPNIIEAILGIITNYDSICNDMKNFEQYKEYEMGNLTLKLEKILDSVF